MKIKFGSGLIGFLISDVWVSFGFIGMSDAEGKWNLGILHLPGDFSALRH
ncbi:hypothetical protein [Noviherbaspirillum sp.]